MTATAEKSLILNFQPNYNSNRQHQSNGVRNKLILAQSEKTGEDEGKTKDEKRKPQRNLDHITCNEFGEK